jgi:glycosyltransferase involved in cell wall biosynthesis
LSKLNHDALLGIYCERMVLFELSKSGPHGLTSLIKAFMGHIDGLSEEKIAKAIQTIQFENVDKVFVDGSNLGGIVKAIKQRLPQVEVSTFFHNVESRFFLGSLRQAKTLRALAVLIVNYLAERRAVRYSDKVICLSERDSHLLRKVYRRAATHISPIALQDKLPHNFTQIDNASSEKFILFVGGGFYANRDGITWFVKNVVPRLSIKTLIVGRGFEDLRPLLGQEGKVEVIGSVDSLAQWYRDAYFVIAPIFDGSGMKTKVAEALMFGKKIVGTPEAFSGYEQIAERAGWVCTTAEEFVAAIDRVQKMPLQVFDPELRALYEERFSFPAARSRFAEIFGSVA